MNKTFDFYADPSHGWLKVPTKLLYSLGIISEITPYSYCHKKGFFAFLEEDLDVDTFLKAYREKYSFEPKIKSHHTNRSSKIRSYYCFDNTVKDALIKHYENNTTNKS